MKKSIPGIIDLALEYGTISQKQFAQISSLPQGNAPSKIHNQIKFMLAQKWITQYQIDLLVLLRNYHLVRKTGEEFGQIVLEKGFASKKDIDRARNFQKEEFKRFRTRKLIGEILLERKVITKAQRDEILQEQTFFPQQSKKISYKGTENEIFCLEPYETQSLKSKTLDQEFAARVAEKGFATQVQIQKAYKQQNDQISEGNQLSGLDQILVDMEIISHEQRSQIKAYQKTLAAKDPENASDESDDLFSLKILHEKMIAEILLLPKALEGISQGQPDFSQRILSLIKQKAKDQKISMGVYWDALLFCHIRNKSPRFLLACQNFSSELCRSKQAEFLPENSAEKIKTAQRGSSLTKENAARPTTQNTCQTTDIFGETKDSLIDSDFIFRPGPGTRLSREGTGIVADRSGRPWVSLDRKVYVFPDLHVLEDMDQKYGPAPDAYADLFVSGMITGAYPITAGKIKSREIRGGTIDSLGDIQVEDGITEAFINTQGSIHATYLHNCHIQAFGDICIKNEIIDCQIQCSGKILSPSCRVVSSFLSARQGVFIQGIGSERSGPCTISAGSEEHLVTTAQTIQRQIDSLELPIQNIKERIQRLENLSKKTFRKMQGVKIFHDEARKKKQELESRHAKIKEKISMEQQQNIVLLVSKFESRMNQAIGIIKELNPAKKRIDKNIHRLRQKLEQEEKAIAPRMLDLQQEMIALYEWARKKESKCEIQCSGKALKGTVLQGVYSEILLDQDTSNFTTTEIFTGIPAQNASPVTTTLSQYFIQISPGTSSQETES